MDFNYKKYSLEQLENWMHDAISAGEASPHEIYSTIRGVVQEQCNYHKENFQKCFGLLELLSGHRSVNLDNLVDKDSFLRQDRNSNFPNENTLLEDVLKEREYYEQGEGIQKTYDEMIALGYTMTDDGFWMPPQKEDKVVKWVLPVNVDGLSGDCYVKLPDDLLERAGLLEGETVEWIDRGDGSFEMRKVNGIK